MQTKIITFHIVVWLLKFWMTTQHRLFPYTVSAETCPCVPLFITILYQRHSHNSSSGLKLPVWILENMQHLSQDSPSYLKVDILKDVNANKCKIRLDIVWNDMFIPSWLKKLSEISSSINRGKYAIIGGLIYPRRVFQWLGSMSDLDILPFLT